MCRTARVGNLVMGDGEGVLLGRKRSHLHGAARGGGRRLGGAVHFTARGSCGARAIRISVPFAVENLFYRRFASMVVNGAVLCDKEGKQRVDVSSNAAHE